MPILRVTARWSGFAGAPGYSNFHFQSSTGVVEAAEARNEVHTFFSTLSARLAPPVRIEVESTVEVLDDATGALVSYVQDGTELAPIVGATTGSFSGPTGAVVNWLTNSVVNGRRSRGRTFIVPLVSTAFDTDGTLTGAALADLNNAAEGLAGDGFTSGFGILSRPAGGGTISFSEVTGYRVPDMAAVLRSRRD